MAWSVLANRSILNSDKVENRHLPSSYKLEELDLEGINFPPTETDVSKFPNYVTVALL